MNGSGEGAGPEAPPLLASLNENPGGRRPALAPAPPPHSPALSFPRHTARERGRCAGREARALRAEGAAPAGSPHGVGGGGGCRSRSFTPRPRCLSFRKHRASVVPNEAPGGSASRAGVVRGGAATSRAGAVRGEQAPPGRVERRSRRPASAGRAGRGPGKVQYLGPADRDGNRLVVSPPPPLPGSTPPAAPGELRQAVLRLPGPGSERLPPQRGGEAVFTASLSKGPFRAALTFPPHPPPHTHPPAGDTM